MGHIRIYGVTASHAVGAHVRVYGVTAQSIAPAPKPHVRVYGVTAQAIAATPKPHVRVYGVQAQSVAAPRHIRVYGVQASSASTLQAPAAQIVQSGTPVTMSATYAQANSFEWQQTAGDTLSWTALNGDIAFVAPYEQADTTYTFQVRATRGDGTKTDWATTQVLVKQHPWWVGDNGQFVPIALGATKVQPHIRIHGVRATSINSTVTPPPTSGLYSDGVPFFIPDGTNGTQDIHTYPKKYFAHYFGPYPRSLDNVADSTGEAGDEYSTVFNNPSSTVNGANAYGGYFRNRPIYRAHDSSSSWQVNDCMWDIQQAYNAGLDGFFCDLLGLSGSNYNNYEYLKTALRQLRAQDAKYNNFYVMAMIDANGNTATQTSDVAGNYVASFNDTAYHLPDGRMLWSCFLAEGKAESWWQGVADYLTGQNIPNAFIAVFNNFNQAPNYTGVTYGEGYWGNGADPAAVNATGNLYSLSKGRSKAFMQPLEWQDCRPRNQLYDEAIGTASGRASWNKAITQGADFIQAVTWSDYSENTEIAPSVARGWTTLDIGAYYMIRWKTGAFPTISRDALYLSHRDNLSTSSPTSGQTEVMKQWTTRPAISQVQDVVEVLSFLTAPADVTVTVAGNTYTYSAPAGVYSHTVALAVGAAPTATAVRSGTTVASVSSPRAIQAAPLMDDKQYFCYSSLRGNAGQLRHPGPNPPYPNVS